MKISKIRLTSVMLALAASAAVIAAPAAAQVKIGFVTTLTGGAANIGTDMRDAVELALDHMDRKMGGKAVTVIYEDDDQKPEIGKQKAEKLVQSDKVDFVSGFIWSNVLLAAAKPVLDSKTFLVNTNAGAVQLIGAQCNPFFFSTSWGNDQMPRAMGELLNQKGIGKVYTITGNYAAGRDMVAGFQSSFKGQIIGADFTKWPDQLDFSAELSKIRAANPQGVFFFYPGPHAVQFLTQYKQAGLTAPTFSVFSLDALSLPLVKDAAVGSIVTGPWAPDLPFPANQKFVNDFKKKYKRIPTFYAAQTYDGINLIASAANALKGDLSNKDKVRAELKKANFASVRGPFAFGNNQAPIAAVYQEEVVKDKDGNYDLLTVSTITDKDQSVGAAACKMP